MLPALKSTRVTLETCPPLYATPLNPNRPNRLPVLRGIAEALGYELIPWQEHNLAVMSEVHHDGCPYYRFGLTTVPRQTGKTEVCAWCQAIDRMCYWPRLPQHIIWRAQSLSDTLDVFNTKMLPRLMDSPLWKWGDWQLRMRGLSNPRMICRRTGSTLRVVSTGKSSGHGGTVGQVITDEAWAESDMSAEQALAFAQRTIADRQYLIYSTAGTAKSDYLRGLVEAGRQQVIDGVESRSAFMEWGAPDDADIDDPEVWKKATPSWGWLVDAETMQTEHDRYARLGKIGEFKRAALNMWVDSVEDPVIPYDIFDRLVWGTPITAPRLWMAADAPPDRSAGYIVISDGTTVEPVRHTRGVWGMYELLRKCWERNTEIEAIILIKDGPFKDVGERLESELGIQVIWYDWNMMKQACGAFHEAAVSDRLRLYDAPDVQIARSVLTQATRKETERGGWLYVRHDTSMDISILLAMSMAYHAASTEGRWTTDENAELPAPGSQVYEPLGGWEQPWGF